MKEKFRSLLLSVTISLLLVSCGFSSNSSTPQAPLLVAQSTATMTVAEQVNLELSVQADTSTPFTTVGQVVKFTYTIKVLRNDTTGLSPNITIAGVTLNCPAVNTVGNLNDRLDAGETIVCTSDYAITQADLDKGSVTNLATVNVYTVNSNQVSTTVNTVPAKALTLTKSADPLTYDRLGQTITYNYVIKNSGSLSLGPAQFTVTDAAISNPINCGAADTTLASNATVACSATYTITQADMNTASLVTSATASGGGVGPSQPASATVTKSTSTQTSSSSLTAGSTIKHQVVSGEWIWQIARCYGVDPIKLQQANPQLANPAQISPDMTLTVPNIGSAGKIYGPPCIGTHTVQSGDTWSSIAAKYNADAAVLQMVNSNTLTVGKVLKVPLNSAGAVTTTTPSNTASNCVDLTRPIKFANANPVTTYFKVCGTLDSSSNMKIATINILQKPEEAGVSAFTQNIAVTVDSTTPINTPTSLIVADMNYDGNDDFRIVKFLPAGPNIPYLYYLYDPATGGFVYSKGYENITSPEFPGNSEIRSQWRESAVKWGIDTYTVANNTPRLTKRETWEAVANTTNAIHQITVFNADGTSQMTVNETIPMPIQP
jgi:LysM repeat protein